MEYFLISACYIIKASPHFRWVLEDVEVFHYYTINIPLAEPLGQHKEGERSHCCPQMESSCTCRRKCLESKRNKVLNMYLSNTVHVYTNLI